MARVNVRKVVVFCTLTCAGSWLIALVFVLLGVKWQGIAATLVAILYMMVPMTAAIVVQKVFYAEGVKRPLGIYFRFNRWFVVAWLVPPLLVVAALGVSLLFPDITYSPAMEGMYERYAAALTPEQVQQMREQSASLPIHPFWLGLAGGLVAGATLNAAVAFGEELGWRGFLQRELGPLGFWRSAGLIGVIWGIWHAPLILQGHNYYQHPVVGVFMMTAMCVLLSPIIGYVRLRAKSVIAAAIFHGTFNGTAGLALIVVRGGNDLTVGITGAAGMIVLALANVGLFLYDRHPAGVPEDMPPLPKTSGTAAESRGSQG